MGYEARADARNEYNAQIAHEARNEFESELEGIIAGAIEAGEYDVEVLERATVILLEQAFDKEGNLLKELKELLIQK